MLLYSYIAKSATKTRIDRWREIQVIVDLSICRFLPERVGLNFRTVLSKIRRIVEKINILLSSRIVGLLVGERLRIFAVEEILLPISICLLQAFDESTRNLHLKGIMHLDDMKMLILLSHPQRNAS